jgi:hypothetical protein
MFYVYQFPVYIPKPSVINHLYNKIFKMVDQSYTARSDSSGSLNNMVDRMFRATKPEAALRMITRPEMDQLAARPVSSSSLGILDPSLLLFINYFHSRALSLRNITAMSSSCQTKSEVGKHPDLMVGLPTSTVFPEFEISQFFRKKFEKI